MPSLNKVMIIGNLGDEPQMRFTSSGKPTTAFRVATNTRFKVGDEVREETEWFSVVTWGKEAEICNKYLHKGSCAYVEGRAKTRSWEGQDGQKHWRTELIANRVIFLDKIDKADKADKAKEASADDEVVPEDLPF